MQSDRSRAVPAVNQELTIHPDSENSPADGGVVADGYDVINADRIHAEWQGLKVDDRVRMCPGEDWEPPPYEVAILEPDHAIVMGHQENGMWSDLWQFIVVPQADGTTRLILRGRDQKSGGIWDVIRPGIFIMERGMLLGIKERAEGMAQAR